MPRKPKEYDDDDGRVIVNMDVEGMKWHDKRVRQEKRAERAKKKDQETTKMTKSETRRFTFYAVLAGLTIALIFAVVWILLTLFATQVWLR